MRKTLLLLALLLSGCDMIMETDVKQIPDGFEVEEFIYVHGRFPDCYSSVSRITEKSAEEFLKNKDAFRHSEYLNRQYEAWKPTPVPPKLLDEDDWESIGTVKIIESGIGCYEMSPDKIDPYYKDYWGAIESGGGHYAFLEDSENIFMLYIPEKRLLFHTVR